MRIRRSQSHTLAVAVGAVLLAAMGVSACSSGDESAPGPGSNTVGELNGPGDELADEGGAVADPLAPYDVQIQFDITVPAYRSNELQVRVALGDEYVLASWSGDELWSASMAFPAATQTALVVTFSDQNGQLVLGSYSADVQTGTNTVELFEITAERFDIQSWDSDGDGISNLDEGIAGTNPLNAASGAAAGAAGGAAHILLFSETRDFRHESTEDALQALEQIASSAGMATDRANDSAGVFTDANLANYSAVAWVMTSGDVLDSEEQAAFERFIRAGGGYAGIHAASFTEYDWPWYGALVGAYFASHPDVQVATQVVEDQTHPSTAHLDSVWTRTDEWYDYRSNPRSEVNVLLSLDRSSYTGGLMVGLDHPSAWYHDYDGGRSWYTGGGHTSASYTEPDFLAHLLGGLRYAAGVVSP